MNSLIVMLLCRPLNLPNSLTGEQKVRQSFHFGKIGEPLFGINFQIYNYHINFQNHQIISMGL